jgi:glycosyltransferase involved in cell wall biosynthesis
MKISVCIPAFRPDTLRAPIQSILRQTWDEWELIVVGQGSSDSKRAKRVIDVVKEYVEKDPRVQYVHSDSVGHSRVLNLASQKATGEIVAFLDDDCEANTNWLEMMAKHYEKYPHVGVIGGSVIAPKSEKLLGVCPELISVEAIYDPHEMNFNAPDGWGWISANISFRKEILTFNGPFDHFLGPGTKFPAGGETDYNLRLEKKGVVMFTTPKVSVLHKYGHRYGVQAVWNLSKNYAVGNGALAGKLVLMGDSRGKEWLTITRRNRLLGWLKPFRPHRIILNIVRLNDFYRAYYDCINNYGVKDDLLFCKK